MKNRLKNRLLKTMCLALILVMSAGLVGCYANGSDLMDGIKPGRVDTIEGLTVEGGALSTADFAVRLFRESSANAENVLVSPLSVMLALAMTQNGADGETLAQMESVLGLEKDELNKYLYSLVKMLPENDKCSLKLANSIWFSDIELLQVKKDFLQTNADYYGADAYKISFDDTAADKINGWVKEKTSGMIDKLVDTVSPGEIIYLINALSFEGEWAEKYTDENLWERAFTSRDGSSADVMFMHSGESYYLEDTDATGFIKHYKGGDFAFVALLPKEGMSVNEYVSTLDGEKLRGIFESVERCDVETAIPKFEIEYDCELSAPLTSMGMGDAFDEDKADFSPMAQCGDENIYITDVLHKTYISVDEAGTKAAAVTGVVLAPEGEADVEEPKQVYLTRPFLYMIIECTNSTPVFMGCVNYLGDAK